jgi:hypothetical protein
MIPPLIIPFPLICPLLPNFKIAPGGIFQVLLMTVSLFINMSCENAVDEVAISRTKISKLVFINYKCGIKVCCYFLTEWYRNIRDELIHSTIGRLQNLYLAEQYFGRATFLNG